MMYQSKSRLAGKAGALALLPALAIGVVALSTPALASVIADASDASLMESARKVSKNSDNAETAVSLSAPDANADAGRVEATAGDEQVMAQSEALESAPVGQDSEEPESADAPVEAEQGKVYMAVETPAEFPGGIPALMQWLCMNIRYPEDAQKNDTQGRVIVRFVVDTDGSVSDATVVKGVSESLDNEAIRVVESMPKWKPAENNGEKVASYYNIPISFKLTDPEPDDSAAKESE